MYMSTTGVASCRNPSTPSPTQLNPMVSTLCENNSDDSDEDENVASAMKEQTRAPTMEFARSIFAGEPEATGGGGDGDGDDGGNGNGEDGNQDSAAAVMVGIARDRAQLALAAELRERRQYFAELLPSMMEEVGSTIVHPRNRFDF